MNGNGIQMARTLKKEIEEYNYLKKDYVSLNAGKEKLNLKKKELNNSMDLLKKYQGNLQEKMNNPKTDKSEIEALKDKIASLNKNLSIPPYNYHGRFQDLDEKTKIIQVKIEKLEKEILKKLDDFIQLLINEIKVYKERINENPRYRNRVIPREGIDPKIKELEGLEFNDFKMDIFTFINAAKEKEVNIDTQFLDISCLLFGYKTVIAPDVISDFIKFYLQDLKLENVLDLWAGVGSFITQLSDFDNIKATGLVDSPNELSGMKKLYNDNCYEWKNSSELNKLELMDKFDFIFGFVPLKSDRISEVLHNDEHSYMIYDKESLLRILKTSPLLKDNGYGFFILDHSFLANRNPRTVIEHLSKFNLYIDAIIDIPNTMNLGTDKNNLVSRLRGGQLIVIKKGKGKNLFVGEFSEDINSNTILLNNFKERKEGKLPQLGSLTNINSFYSFKAYLAKLESKNMAKNSGLEAISFSDVVKKINFLHNRNESFKETKDAFYLPRREKMNAITSLEDINHPMVTLQVVLDTEKAYPEYLASFFNNPLGLKIRESLAVGINQMIKRSMLMDTEIYLPDIDTQIETVNVSSLINDLSSQLDTYERNLWKRPKKNKEIKREVELLKIGNRLEYWINTLPFPLSSILNTCSATNNPEYKWRYLLHFFEALSVFNVNIMLSALLRDEKFCRMEFIHCINSLKPSDWYYKPSFGNWNHLGSCLAKKVRKLLDDDEKIDICFNLFGNPSKDFLEMISNKEMYEILRKVAEYRNTWIGHGPPVSNEENRNRVKTILNLLSKVRKIISHNYEEALLISKLRGGRVEYDDGGWSTEVNFIRGRLPFNGGCINTIHPLKGDTFYLLHENQYEAVELLPLIRMMESPRKEHNACYFYNRYERGRVGEEIRLVSYHFDKDAINSCSYDQLGPFLSLFNHKD